MFTAPVAAPVAATASGAGGGVAMVMPAGMEGTDAFSEFRRMLRLSKLCIDGEEMTDDQRDAMCNMGESLGLTGGEAEDLIDEYLEEMSNMPPQTITAPARSGVATAAAPRSAPIAPAAKGAPVAPPIKDGDGGVHRGFGEGSDQHFSPGSRPGAAEVSRLHKFHRRRDAARVVGDILHGQRGQGGSADRAADHPDHAQLLLPLAFSDHERAVREIRPDA